MADRPKNVDDYIESHPAEVQAILTQVRRTLAKAVPGSGETMSYQMPTVTLNGKALMYFAGWKKHIGIYPIPVLEAALEQRITPYRSGKDSVKFPLREPIPYDLIEQVAAVLRRRRAEDDRDSSAA